MYPFIMSPLGRAGKGPSGEEHCTKQINKLRTTVESGANKDQ